MRETRILFIALFAIFMGVAASAQAQTPAPKTITVAKEEIKKMSGTKAIIETKFGNITLKFFPEVAPGHVKNFIDLAKKGFYDGTTFHRVIPGFMIQGGDPNSKDPNKSKHGQGGPGYTIKAEFNDKPHKRGTLSMARAGHPDSAGSAVLHLRQGLAVPRQAVHRVRRGGERHRGRGQDRVPAPRRERQPERPHRDEGKDCRREITGSVSLTLIFTDRL